MVFFRIHAFLTFLCKSSLDGEIFIVILGTTLFIWYIRIWILQPFCAGSLQFKKKAPNIITIKPKYERSWSPSEVCIWFYVQFRITPSKPFVTRFVVLCFWANEWFSRPLRMMYKKPWWYELLHGGYSAVEGSEYNLINIKSKKNVILQKFYGKIKFDNERLRWKWWENKMRPGPLMLSFVSIWFINIIPFLYAMEW